MAQVPDIYSLSRNFWDYSFRNPEKVRPTHAALFFFAVDLCNRLGWKEKFGLPTTMAKEAIGIGSYNTYVAAFRDLVEWGFFTLIEKSKNQYSSNIIALSKNDKATDKATDEPLDKALTKHASKQLEHNNTNLLSYKSTTHSEESLFDLDSLYSFSEFWNDYEKKVGDKDKLEKKWKTIKLADRKLIKEYIPKYKQSQPDKKYRKDPSTFLNNKSWNDEIIEGKATGLGIGAAFKIKKDFVPI